MAVSRRNILSAIGLTGGYGAAFAALQSLGYFEAAASPLSPRPKDFGGGEKVVILGAGISGLTAAYELEQAGYSVTLIEARERVGGRNWTLRRGSRIEAEGQPDQLCRFSEGVYANMGPGRIPGHHHNLLGYCQKFGVELQIEVNSNRSALLVSNKGDRVRMRAAINDMRGHIAELLSKAMSHSTLDGAITAEEREKLLPFLKTYGDLDETGRYLGSQRATDPVIGPDGRDVGHGPPLSLSDLFANEQLAAMLFEEEHSMQAAMLEPVGGMDRIPEAFRRAIRGPVLSRAVVTAVRRTARGVSVSYRDLASGKLRQVEAHHAICTLPLPILARMNLDLPTETRAAIAGVAYGPSCKIAFEAPRFWEKEGIYGGLSFVGGDTGSIWYPSYGLNSGTPAGLVAVYCSGPRAEALGKLPHSAQIDRAQSAIERAHPGQARFLDRGLVVNWEHIRYSLGAWPDTHGADTPGLIALRGVEGPILFAGGHLTHLPSWQEGAILSAHIAVNRIFERRQALAG